jgi:hypothetical protein
VGLPGHFGIAFAARLDAPKTASILKDRAGTHVGSAEGFFVTGGEGPLKGGEQQHAAAWAAGLVGDDN